MSSACCASAGMPATHRAVPWPTSADCAVVGEAGDGAEVLPLVARVRPDVLLMDVRMPAVDGIQATRHLLATSADPPRILVITTFENDEYVYEALRAGASGFLR